MLRDMFKKTYTRIDTSYSIKKQNTEQKIPSDLWRKCNKCGKPIYVRNAEVTFASVHIAGFK